MHENACMHLLQNFVLQRWARRGGEGLVLSNQPIGMQVLEAGPSTAPLAGASSCESPRAA